MTTPDMLADFLPVIVAFLPFAAILFVIYRFVGKKVAKRVAIVFGALLFVLLLFALF